MKKYQYILTLCTLLTIFSQNAQSQSEVKIGYLNHTARGLLGESMPMLHGVSATGGYKFPKLPLAIGVDLGIGLNMQNIGQQAYGFDSQFMVNAELWENTQALSLGLNVRLDFFNRLTRILPYVQAQAGYVWLYSDLTLENPRQQDASLLTSNCPKPLESEVLSYDSAPILGLGTGFRINLGNIADSDMESKRFFIDFNVSYIFGSEIEYVSTDSPSTSSTMLSSSETVSIKFASETAPQDVYEREAGYRYDSNLEWIDFRVSVGMFF